MSSKDTTIEVAKVRFSILRRLGTKKRADMAIELSDGLRETLESGVRQRHPDYDENQVRLAAIRLAIGKELFNQAYPHVDTTSL